MSRPSAAAIAGAIAGFVMSMMMMGWMVVKGQSIWSMPNLIGVMWFGPEAAGSAMSVATLAGFLTHVVTSVAMGLVAIPFIRDLSRGRTTLASVAYAIASYPVVFALVLSWANPLMVERTELLPMTLGHALFGLVMGPLYWKLRRG